MKIAEQMIYKWTYIFLILVLLPLTSKAAGAQRDEFGNDPEIQSLYDQAYKHFNTKEGLADADSLFKMAGKKHDTKLQARAMLIKAKYLDANLGSVQFKTEARKIMGWMRAHHNLDDYYHVWLYIIMDNCDEKHYVDAYDEIKRLTISASKDNCPYGIQGSYRMMGTFYKSRLMFQDALKYYYKELEYAKKIKSPSLYSCYYNIAACEYRLGMFDKALESSKKGRNLSKLPIILNHFIAQEGIIYGVMGKYDKLEDCFMKVSNYVKNNAVDAEMQKKYEMLKVVVFWSHKRFKESMDEIDNLDKNDRMILLPFLYERLGRFDLAYRAMTGLTAYRDSLKDLTSKTDLNTFNYKLNEQRLIRDKQRLEIENAHIKAVQLRMLTISLIVILFLLLTVTVVIIVSQRKRNKVIAAENASKDQFIRDMSHEIRTPLNGINGFMSILTDPSFRLSGNDMKAAGEVIKKSTNQLTLILNNMLDLSDFESGLAKFTYSEHRPHDICEEAMGVACERCPENVVMKTECDVPIDMTFITDGEKLIRVLIGLLVNACINTEKGEIVIGCNLTENRGKITFYVQDTGCGVPADKAEEIFKRFVKLDSFKPGIGIGLTIARVISHELHASLKLDTTYQGGARFVLTHPLHSRKPLVI